MPLTKTIRDILVPLAEYPHLRDTATLRDAFATLKEGFATRLKAAHAALNAQGTQGLVLGVLRVDLLAELEQKVAAQRQTIVATVENWWEKYRRCRCFPRSVFPGNSYLQKVAGRFSA